ncbi:MAG: CesT family type III secretion system chaperone [Puniceicoccales bacterium]|nr:CesT family type III secretion system chaperone [Puniceicoccales bacterium]
MGGKELLQEAARLMRLPVRLDAEMNRLTILDKAENRQLHIELPARSQLLYIYAVLRKLGPERDNPAFLRALLELNLFGLQTNTTALSLDNETDALLVHLYCPLEFLTPQLLVNTIGNFVATARKLREKVENLLIATNQELRRSKSHFSAADALNRNKIKENIRIIRI